MLKRCSARDPRTRATIPIYVAFGQLSICPDCGLRKSNRLDNENSERRSQLVLSASPQKETCPSMTTHPLFRERVLIAVHPMGCDELEKSRDAEPTWVCATPSDSWVRNSLSVRNSSIASAKAAADTLRAIRPE